MKTKERRLAELEKAKPAEKVIFIVKWDLPGEPEPGTIILTWGDEGMGETGEHEEQAEQDD